MTWPDERDLPAPCPYCCGLAHPGVDCAPPAQLPPAPKPPKCCRCLTAVANRLCWRCDISLCAECFPAHVEADYAPELSELAREWR